MTLTFASVIASAGIDAAELLVIRYAYVCKHEDGIVEIRGESSDAEIMAYTIVQSASTRTVPAVPPRVWIVFRPEGVTGSAVGQCSWIPARPHVTGCGARSTSRRRREG